MRAKCPPLRPGDATFGQVSRRLAVLATLFAGLAAAPAAHARPVTDSYRGPGAWVDLYSRRQLAAPEATVRTLAAHGVHTLYLETGNWGNRRAEDVRYPDVAARFITAAHDAGLTVVAWYLPGLRPRDPDLRHCLGAIDFQTADHDGFDGFAMDIESTFIGSIRARDRALLALSARLRDEVGADYPLGAIVPDSRS